VVNAMARCAAVDTSQAMDEGQRRHWRTRWGTTRWQLAQADGGWLELPGALATGSGALFALSAWNPGSVPLPVAVNRARDALLRDELQARGEHPRRMRGGDPQAGWWEEGWLVGHQPARDAALLRRYGQLAGLVLSGGAMALLWCDGVQDAP
jgi:hypothetical protein